MPHQIPADATPVLTRTKQTIGYVAPVHPRERRPVDR